jgi:ABC-type molybdate transport system substrate-binding protein
VERAKRGFIVIQRLEISTPTGLVGFVSAHAKEPAAARALLDYLSGPEAAKVYRDTGMEPGR